MTLDQIETFLAVADCGSFKAASEQLHRSQPALSVAVKKLEEELGIKLFDREQYRPILSPQGKAFYHKAKDFFQQSQGLQKFAQEIGMGEEPEISLAIDSLCPLDLVMETLKHFSKDHPDTRLNISFEVLGGANEKLEEGAVQLAISPSIGLAMGNLKVDSLLDVTMVPVLGKSSSLKIKNGDITQDELKSFPQIIVRDSSQRPGQRSFGVLEGARQWSVKDLDTKTEIILAGLGWGRIPLHRIEKPLKKGDLIELSINTIKREIVPICLVSSEKYPMGPLTQKMRELFLNTASKYSESNS